MGKTREYDWRPKVIKYAKGFHKHKATTANSIK